MTNWIRKSIILLLLGLANTSFAAGYLHSNAYVHVPSVTEKNSHPGAMVGLHNTVAIASFYEELLLSSEKFVQYDMQSKMYRRILAELTPEHLQFASSYAQRFVAKWKKDVIKRQKSFTYAHMPRAEHTRIQMQEIQHYLKKDIALLEAKRVTPRGLVALANTRAVIEAGKEVSAHFNIVAFNKIIGETARKATQPFMIGIIDEVIRTDRSKMNIALVDQLTKPHPKNDLVHYDYNLTKLVDALRVNAEVKL